MVGSQATDMPHVDSILRAVAERGWTERLADKFERAYGRKLRWKIVVQMEKLGLLQRRVRPDSVDCLSSRRLELYENVVSDLWAELLGGLVGQYLDRVEQGKIHQQFMPYMGGVVRNVVIRNARSLGLLGEESPGELLHSICEAKGEKTRQKRVAWAKYCLEQRVRSELLMRCPSSQFPVVYTNIHHVSDYFFESYVPTECGKPREQGGSLLDELLERFSEMGGELDQATTYRGQVTPFPRWEEARLESLEGEGEQYIAGLAQAADQGWL